MLRLNYTESDPNGSGIDKVYMYPVLGRVKVVQVTICYISVHLSRVNCFVFLENWIIWIKVISFIVNVGILGYSDTCFLHKKYEDIDRCVSKTGGFTLLISIKVYTSCFGDARLLTMIGNQVTRSLH
jgi:hypothetical protein